jgi:hypothetical protein
MHTRASLYDVSISFPLLCLYGITRAQRVKETEAAQNTPCFCQEFGSMNKFFLTPVFCPVGQELTSSWCFLFVPVSLNKEGPFESEGSCCFMSCLIWVCVCVCTCMRWCWCVRVFMCACMRLCVYTRVCAHVWVYKVEMGEQGVCMCTCMCVRTTIDARLCVHDVWVIM